MRRELTGRLRVIRLFDVYGPLFTRHQQRLLRLYYHDDLSLGEIAQRLLVSRQAVFDALRRSTEELERLEAAVGMAAREEQFARRQRRLHEALNGLEAALRRLAGRRDRAVVAEVRQNLHAVRRHA